MFDIKELEAKGYSRPMAAHQANGGRASAVWDTAVIGDAKKALADQALFRRLADQVKPGNVVMVAFFDTALDFKAEKLAATAEVLVVSVRLPEKGKPDSGEVRHHELRFFDLKGAQSILEGKRLAGAA